MTGASPTGGRDAADDAPAGFGTTAYPAPIPRDEPARLAALHALGILDTAVEPRFERITSLATMLFDVPVSLVTLVDRDRQWFKSARGFPLRETPRDISLCGHAIHEQRMMVVPDTHADERFRGNPLVSGGLGVRFYAGAVLRAATGHALGTLCLIDHRPRELEERERELLLRLARIAEDEVLHSERLGRLHEDVASHAFIDPATGLPNQHLFREWLATRLDALHGGAASSLLARVRVKAFTELTTVYGPAPVCELLGRWATVLHTELGPGCLVARTTHDELSVLVEIGSAPARVDAMLNNAITALAAPVRTCVGAVVADAAVGALVLTRDAGTLYDAENRAGLTVERAAAQTRSAVRIHDAAHDREIQRRLHVDRRLRGAARTGALDLRVQPQVRLADGALIGGEVLMRWTDPELGAVPPSEFIPIAESNGVILELGEWLLDVVCERLAGWVRDGVEPVPLSVNVSAVQLFDDGFAGRLLARMHHHRIVPAHLVLEVTETALIRDLDRVRRVMRSLCDEGLRFAIDDFGIGYSCLSYLQSLPLHALKVDRAFVSSLGSDAGETSLIAAIFALGRSLGLDPIAEGVETEGQRSTLLALGCEHAQGFLFARPMTLSAFERLMRGDGDGASR